MAVGGRRVIAGVSGSLRSLGALRAGIEEARQTGAPLLAVLAWVPAGGELAYRRAPCPLLLRLWEQAARERLTEAFDAALGGVPADVTVRGMVVRGRAGPVLVDLADRPDDVLVVGCGGGNWLTSTVHGSVTRYCLAHARCPVLAVPPPEMIADVRSRSHRWRPEDFATPLDARPAATPGSESARRAATVTSERPASMRDLPAYRGAPYYQPGPPSRKARILRRLRLACILLTAILLVVLTGVLLAQSLP
ncbi:MAG TPA: universal stress protein [Streptosporangiaceae bacterium]|nr:universal stress protein [Streptosporangiaceae bacterium]